MKFPTTPESTHAVAEAKKYQDKAGLVQKIAEIIQRKD